jgi:hypothetical protein
MPSKIAVAILVVFVLACLLHVPAGAEQTKLYISSVAFNYPGSQAITIWDDKDGVEITSPECEISSNKLVNPDATSGFSGWTTWETPTVEEVDGDSRFVLRQEGSHIHQDIDLSEYAGRIDAGLVTVTITGDLKAEDTGVREGFPYLYGYLFGTENDEDHINTYMTTNAVKVGDWTHVAMTYPLPQHTRKARVFMQRSGVQGVDDQNTA